MTIKSLLNITTFLDTNKRYYSKELFSKFFKDFNIEFENEIIFLTNKDMAIFCTTHKNKILDYEIII